MTTSVLRMADQRAGRIPDVCILTGVSTSNAVRLRAVEWSHRSWLLGIPGATGAARLWPGRASVPVVLPVDGRIWRMWNRRNGAAIVAMMFGIGLLSIGVLRGAGGPATVGGLILAMACGYRTRAAVNYWVTCRYDPDRDTASITPTHPAFDAQATALFVRALH